MIVGLSSLNDAGRRDGLALAAISAVLWSIAVPSGTVKIRRRGRRQVAWRHFTRLAFILIVGEVAATTIAETQAHPLVYFANFLSGGLSGLAASAVALRALKR